MASMLKKLDKNKDRKGIVPNVKKNMVDTNWYESDDTINLLKMPPILIYMQK